MSAARASNGGPDVSWALSQRGGIHQPEQDTRLSHRGLSVMGGTLPHAPIQPYLTLNLCHALQGISHDRWSL